MCSKQSDSDNSTGWELSLFMPMWSSTTAGREITRRPKPEINSNIWIKEVKSEIHLLSSRFYLHLPTASLLLWLVRSRNLTITDSHSQCWMLMTLDSKFLQQCPLMRLRLFTKWKTSISKFKIFSTLLQSTQIKVIGHPIPKRRSLSYLNSCHPLGSQIPS